MSKLIYKITCNHHNYVIENASDAYRLKLFLENLGHEPIMETIVCI